ncbi:hypothetical protein [Singulisphaera sp. PoT]|uniref:hypothetical protein n=1 Tax=Singulisphaera sp. PoT TaxID=3411797 RepID=UPI003BF4D3DF
MSFPLHGLFRGIALLAIASTISAVSLGRSAPKATQFRILSGSRFSSVSGYHFSNVEKTPRFLDVETGQFVNVKFKGGEVVDCAACSPWQDDLGTQLMVARWNTNDLEKEAQGYGLSRFSFPTGEELDRYELDVVPTSRPCFFPNSPGRIIFTAGDGHLYKFQFPDKQGASRKTGNEAFKQPKALKWKAERPGEGDPFLSDPVWPADPKFKGYLIVSLAYLDPKPTIGRRVYQRAQLWWLKLNPQATEIVEAGRLLMPSSDEPGHGNTSEVRMPTIAAAPDGTPMVAYIHQPGRGANYQMRLAPIRFEGTQGHPTIHAEESRVVSESCLSSWPAFSGDGRYVFSMDKKEGPRRDATRYSVAEVMERTPSARNVVLQEYARPLPIR